MTTIVGYRDPLGTVWLAADHRLTSDLHHFPARGDKICRYGKWWIGHSGEYRFHQDATSWSLGEATSAYDLSRRITKGLGEFDYKKCDDHRGPPCYEQSMIVSDGVGLWFISGSGAVGVADHRGFFAIGSGADFAYGALHALIGEVRAAPETILSIAILAAAEFDLSTGDGVQIVRCHDTA